MKSLPPPIGINFATCKLGFCAEMLVAKAMMLALIGPNAGSAAAVAV
ncbi:hypothetical protein [Janthinobacterium sp.]|nr:hypothetical protein [Janthinobacterium sp.]